MTVSSITGGVPEFKRALEQQNKPVPKAGEAKTAATFPTDTISSSVIDLEKTIVQVQAQNLEAARSTLNDSDLDALQPTQSAQEKVQQQSLEAVRAQTNKLPPNILLLISE